MNLKDFVKETISAIAEATIELQDEYDEKGILINPPADAEGKDVFEPDGWYHTNRYVKNVDFDVALTATNELNGEGKAGLKVFSVELGGKAQLNKGDQQVSRVQFSIPVTLRPTKHEEKHKRLHEEERARNNAIVAKYSNDSVI